MLNASPGCRHEDPRFPPTVNAILNELWFEKLMTEERGNARVLSDLENRLRYFHPKTDLPEALKQSVFS
jgi:hypothetical protein